MTATSRYWDHELCAWVDYESAPGAAVPMSSGAAVSTSPETAVPEGLAASMPEQRDDEPAKVTAD